MHRLLLCIVFLQSFCVLAAPAADIVALVIGNNAYTRVEDQLDTPINDAELMKRTLEALPGGADVKILTDATREDIQIALNALKVRAQGAKLVLVFYSGHGMFGQPAGYASDETFLIPVDADIPDVDYLDTRAIPVRAILQSVKDTPVLARAIILDCCRTPAPKATGQLPGVTKDFGRLDERLKAALGNATVPEATLVAFSTSEKKKALAFLRNSDDHSPFTHFLSQSLSQGVGNLRDLVENAAETTEKATERHQVPSVTYTGAASAIRQIVFRTSPGVMPDGPVIRTESVDPFAAVSKNAPFKNALGMAFVPAGTPGVLFSVWETRLKDFEAFVEETGHDAISNSTFGAPAYTLEKTADGKGAEWAQKGGSWRDPRFPTKQTGEHPVVCVSYLDAEAFCAWLTKKERASGKIPANASYRLPTDSEWSRAVGGSEFPWGDNFPPSSEDGNYSGKESMVGVYEGFSDEMDKAGRRDSAARTAPVGMFKENRFGLHDMGGNVFEWCSTWYTVDLNDAEAKKAYPVLADDKGGQTYRVLRGASWNVVVRVLMRSAYRNFGGPRARDGTYGFRCVLVVAGG